MKEQKPAHQPPLMSFEATHYEIISLNLAIAYFVRYGAPFSPVHTEACQMLAKFQQRIDEHMQLQVKQL